MEINTSLLGSPFPHLTLKSCLYDCYSVCFSDLLPLLALSLSRKPLSASIRRRSELHILYSALLEISHISRQQQQQQQRFVDDRSGELYKLTLKMNDGVATCALCVLSIGNGEGGGIV